VLAADNMQGRDTGSPALRKAEAYAVNSIKEGGLHQQAERVFFFSQLKFESRQLVEKESSAVLIHNGKAER